VELVVPELVWQSPGVEPGRCGTGPTALGEVLFMFSFKRAVAMDVAMWLAAALDEDAVVV
jgi:hypothetical protein